MDFDTHDDRLTTAGDLKALVRNRAVTILGGDPDLGLEVERAMSEIPVDWDDLPDDGRFLSRLVCRIVDSVKMREELLFS